MRARTFLLAVFAVLACSRGNPFALNTEAGLDAEVFDARFATDSAADGRDAPAADGPQEAALDNGVLDAAQSDASRLDAHAFEDAPADGVIDASRIDATRTDAAAEVRLRFAAANLTSGNGQRYQDEGIRILRSLAIDIALLQEFRYLTGSPVELDEFVTRAFGTPRQEYFYVRESQAGASLPNGIVSRFPIVRSGIWLDLTISNRAFIWAQIDVPGPRDLWAISVHLSATSASKRYCQALELRDYLRCPAVTATPLVLSDGTACETVPPVADPRIVCPSDFPGIPQGDLVMLGGDFNTQSRNEAAVFVLNTVLPAASVFPVDALGNDNTNAPRNRPLDWLVPNAELTMHSAAVELRGSRRTLLFPNGLVFDTRTFVQEDLPAPALMSDSAAAEMQHMAVVRDFVLPTSGL